MLRSSVQRLQHLGAFIKLAALVGLELVRPTRPEFKLPSRG